MVQIHPNSPYRGSKINSEITESNRIRLGRVIFERDKYIVLEVLVVHDRGAPPKITPFGKIAGQDEIAVIDVSVDRNKPALLVQVFGGDSRVQLYRLLSYLPIYLGIIFLPIGIAEARSAVGKKWKIWRLRRTVKNVILKLPEAVTKLETN